jgi:hypothetical protein
MNTLLYVGGLLLVACIVFVALWRNGRSSRSVSQILEGLEGEPKKK